MASSKTPDDLPARRHSSRTRSYGSSYLPSPLAQAAIARDLEEAPSPDLNDLENGDDHDDSSGSESSTLRPVSSGRSFGRSEHSMVGSYRRPSFTAGGGSRATVLPSLRSSGRPPTKSERDEARREERSLLRDNNVIPPKHPQKGDSKTLGRRINQAVPHLGIPGGDRKVVPVDDGPETGDDRPPPSETTPLVGNPELPYGGQDSPYNLDKRWEQAVMEGRIKTTWQREAKVIARYAGPLILTFLLQYSLTVASIFTVGHIGKEELGAVSLASMTANITGYAIFQGLTTSLDTLCAQAYGSGNKKLVGLQLQRMVYFLWLVSIPIAIVWISAEQILVRIVPEANVARLAGLYLKVVFLGAPGYAAFEAGKRFLQAQGLFSASLYVLLICAPFNAFLNWLFVWVNTSPCFYFPCPISSAYFFSQQFKWGFIGAPIAVAVIDNLLPLLLFLYVRFVAGRACWPGLTRRAFHNWGPMIRLAIPGLVMVEAEYFAFEVLTLAASYFGAASLAAQSVLTTIIGITFQIPYPLGIAGSTRIANLIGATLADAARTSAKVTMVTAIAVGLFNMVMLSSLRIYL